MLKFLLMVFIVFVSFTSAAIGTIAPNHITPMVKLGKRCYCNYNGELSNKPKGMIIDFKTSKEIE